MVKALTVVTVEEDASQVGSAEPGFETPAWSIVRSCGARMASAVLMLVVVMARDSDSRQRHVLSALWSAMAWVFFLVNLDLAKVVRQPTLPELVSNLACWASHARQAGCWYG